MSESKSNSSKTLIGVLALVSIAAVVFAVLWLQERDRKPNEVVKEVEKTVLVTNEVPVEKIVQVIKEVPVEKIREVPKEVIKEVLVIKEVPVIKEVEVPAKLTDAQKSAIDFTSRYLSAPLIKTKDEAFYKIETVRVGVFLDDAVKKVVSVDRVKNKLELKLRAQNIRPDDEAYIALWVTVEGLWDKDDIRLTFRRSIELRQHVVIGRKGDLRSLPATFWNEDGVGYAGKNVVEKAILDSVEEMVESFANKLLAVRDKEAAKSSGK